MSIISNIVKKVLRLYYKSGESYQLIVGPLKGSKLHYEENQVDIRSIVGAWELENFGILEKLINHLPEFKQTPTVCDIGSNLGIFSIFFSRYLPSTANIVAFEPSTVVKLLKKNLELNNLTHKVTVVEKAISDKVGTTEFYMLENSNLASSLVSNWINKISTRSNQNIITYAVETISLDAYFASRKDAVKVPDLVKVDIEGAGAFALKGMYETLKQKKYLLFIESHTAEEDNGIVELMNTFNYAAFCANDKQWVKNIANDRNNLQTDWITYLLYPKDRHQEIFDALNK
jgi:FkbM family methyltransferase